MFIPIFRGKHQETNKAIGNINLILLQMHNSYYFISCRLFIFYLRLIVQNVRLAFMLFTYVELHELVILYIINKNIFPLNESFVDA